MPRLNRFQILTHIKPKIINYFKKSKKNIYSIADLDCLLFKCKEEWTLPNLTSRSEFISFLLDKNILKEFKITLNNQTIRKYSFNDMSIYELALSIKKNSYLTHYTALFLHNLTDNVPKNIYTNIEQTNKPHLQNYSLQQVNIDRAFSHTMRATKQIGIVENTDYNIYFLNGKNLNHIGVTNYPLTSTIDVPITNIERTLIDIVVRPNYSGGIYEILSAYKKAKGSFSVNKLVATLKKMEYVYPYHQAIGFYMEKAGYPEKLLKLLERIPIKYDFYLTYQIKSKSYSDRWKLFFPKEL